MIDTTLPQPLAHVVAMPREPDYAGEPYSEATQTGWLGFFVFLLALAAVWLLTFPTVWVVYALAALIAPAGWVGLVATAFGGAFLIARFIHDPDHP